MDSRLKDKNIDFMFATILKLESIEECYKFFEDLCTGPELKAMSQRIAVANMLKNGWVYSDIVNTTGASTATISRVSRSLNQYSCGGYDLVFSRLSEDELSLLPKKDEK